MPGRIRIGISGWRYAGWRGVFYPQKLAQARELDFASRAVQTVEINGSHYSLQSVASYRAWHDATPADDARLISSAKPRPRCLLLLRQRPESADAFRRAPPDGAPRTRAFGRTADRDRSLKTGTHF